ncbi:MAG: hypothetical protein RL565_950, partial [Pseudomonadota bacterium]
MDFDQLMNANSPELEDEKPSAAEHLALRQE